MSMIEQFRYGIDKANPYHVFLADSIGALVSVFMLGFILPRFESVFGMPKRVLLILAGIAFFFFLFSLLHSIFKPKDWKTSMVIIAILNLGYCCLTLFLVIYFLEDLTRFGLVYFMVEIFVILILAFFELYKTSHAPL